MKDNTQSDIRILQSRPEAPYSVLVVEDDQSIRRLLRRNLESTGARVREAATGLACIQAIQEESADLVLLDLRLPDRHGWDILGLIRSQPGPVRVPVIVVSVEDPDQGLLKKFQADGYIQKPFDMRDLLARVGHARAEQGLCIDQDTILNRQDRTSTAPGAPGY